MNSHEVLEMRRRFRALINRQISRAGILPITGVVTAYTSGVELTIRITTTEDQLELNWSEGHIIVLDGQTFIVDDTLLLLPISNRLVVLGKVASTLP